jgi:hypothetical protein
MGRKARGPGGPPGAVGFGQRLSVGIPGWETARRYHPLGPITGGGSTASTAYGPGNLRLYPFALARNYSLDEVKVEVGAANAGSVTRVGIFEGDPLHLGPGPKVAETAEILTATAGVKTTPLVVSLQGGALYWIGFIHGGGVNCSLASTELNISLAQLIIGGGTSAQGVGALASGGGAHPSHLQYTIAYGVLPATLAATLMTAQVGLKMPLLWARASA